jgi:hypothetical protein
MRRATAVAILILLTACSGGNNGAEAVGEVAGRAGIVTVTDVTNAVEAAGLPIINPRDNTDGWCDPDAPRLVDVTDDDLFPCTEMLTTDLFTIRVWVTPEDADHWIEVAGNADPPTLVGDRTTVDFHEGGSTPDYDRAAYEQAIAPLTG